MPESTPGEQEQERLREHFKEKREAVRRRRDEAAIEVGIVLREWRTAHGIKQESLGERALVSDAVVRRVEKGSYGSPPESLIGAVRKLGGPARELQAFVRLHHELMAEQAQLQSQLSRKVLQTYIEGDAAVQDATSSPGTIVVGRRPLPAPAFQRRDDLMIALAASGPVVRVMTGMRGAGKSQLAAARARECIDAGWRLVAWVSAAKTAAVLSGFADVAAKLHLEEADPEILAQAVRCRLEEDGDRCLLVLDDAADIDGLMRVLPSAGQCEVVITSNYERAGALGLHIPVGVFTENQALAFLSQRTNREDQEGAAELAASVGFLPLALAQAAAVVARQRLGYPAFVMRLSKKPLRDYLVRAEGEPYPAGVAEAIALALDDTTGADRTGLAQGLLCLMSLLSPEGVPRSFLQAAALRGLPGQSADEVAADPETVDAMLGELGGSSLLAFTADGTIVTGHPLTMRVVVEGAAAAADGTLSAAAAVAVSVLGDITGSMLDYRRTQNRDAARDAAKQILALREHASPFLGPCDAPLIADLLQLSCWAIECMVKLHDGFSQVIDCGPQIVAQCEQIVGVEDLATLHARTNLATAHYQAGQLDVAISMHKLNLAACQHALGSAHKETLSVRTVLAIAYEDAGNVEGSIPVWEELLADQIRCLGTGHEDTVGTRNDLAHAYGEAGHLDKAMPLHEQVLDDCMRLFGPEHEYTLTSRNNLARAYELAGRLEEATAMYEEALAGFEVIFATNHPYVLQGRHNVAGAYRLAGRLPEAIALYRGVIDERERILGDVHPDTLRSRNNLALALQSAGYTQEATRLMERTVADRERVLGDTHPDTVKSRSELALAYRAAGSSPVER